jgi:hypothetical protein
MRIEAAATVSQPLPPPAPALPTYATIDDVPELVIRSTALSVLGEYGATETDDLCGAVARRLGFKRLGAKIKSQIEASLDALAKERRLELQGDGPWAAG